jgi:hypothetical protein
MVPLSDGAAQFFNVYHEQQIKALSKLIQKNNKRLKKPQQSKKEESFEKIYMKEAVLALI